MPIEFRPLHSIGAEVIGLRLDVPLDDAIKARLYEGWLNYGVLLFREMGVDAKTHLELSRAFGELEEHVLKALSVGGSKELIEVSRAGTPMSPSYYIQGKLTTGYLFWHQDLVFTPSICKGGILRMVVAPTEGGETGWVDTIKAYDALSDRMKQRIDGMEVRHRLRVDLSDVRFGLDPSIREASMEEAPFERPNFPNLPDSVHPLVSIHPETGAKSLAISPLSLVEILGLPKAESDALLTELVEHALQPQFMLVHRWAANDMAIWDNRRTVHSVLGYPPGVTRVAHRTTLAGAMNSGRLYQENVDA